MFVLLKNNRELGKEVQTWGLNKAIKNEDPRQANKNFGALHMEGSWEKVSFIIIILCSKSMGFFPVNTEMQLHQQEVKDYTFLRQQN